MKAAAACALAAGLVAAALGMAVVAAAASLFVGAGPSPGTAGGGATGASSIPPAMLSLYEEAAETCTGLPWSVLAAIGTVESDNDQSALAGVHSGANSAGAEGPMQFEPSTFAAYEDPVPPGGADPPTPYDATDAVYAAARMLCANGAAGGADIAGAVDAYNHSAAYVSEVLTLAQSLGAGTPGASAAASTSGGSGPEAIAAEWALGQIGTPYVWGGETPGVGFDCSGLVQAAYAAAGVRLPRVAQDQYDATPKLPPGTPLMTGDLVFFGDGPAGVDHVGIDVGTQGGQAVMVDAPSSGSDVRVEPFPTAVGASFGDLLYVGATRSA